MVSELNPHGKGSFRIEPTSNFGQTVSHLASWVDCDFTFCYISLVCVIFYPMAVVMQVPNPASEGVFELRRLYDTEFALTTSSTLDREDRDSYNLSVVCEDQGQLQMTSHRSLLIRVADVNDHAPEFLRSMYVGELIENNYIGASVVQVSVRC